jgi:ABC-2 type transport system permease protein
LIQILIICGLAFVLGARFEGGIVGLAVLLVASMLLVFTFASLSNAVALSVRQRESVIGINQFMVLPLTFISAAFMPLSLTPDWLQTLAKINPVNWAVEAGREALTAGPGTADWTFISVRLLGLLVIAILCGALATRGFRSYQKSL